MFINRSIFSLLLAASLLSLSGCGEENSQSNASNPNAQNAASTAPSLKMAVQAGYKASANTAKTVQFVTKSGNFIEDSSVVDAAVSEFQENIKAYSRLGKSLSGESTLYFTNKWSSTATYARAGNEVFYTDGTKSGFFVNSWWTKNNPPSFIPGSNSPWKIVKRTDDAGSAISIKDAVDTWSSAATYTGGDFIKGSDGKCYEAKYWNTNNDPIKEVTHSWETPWQTSTKCADESDAIFGGSNGGAKPPVDVNTTSTVSTGTVVTGTPIIPPVIPAPEPEPTTKVTVTPTPSTPIDTSGSDVAGLPAEGYAFLRQVTDAHWNWLFPLRSGKYNANGGTRNQAPFANADGSTDSFNLANFKKAVLAYNAFAKANNYKQFLNEGTLKQQAQEFVVFWAKSARETSGSWPTANAPWIVEETLGSESVKIWKGAMYWVEEVGHSSNDDGTSPYVAYVDSASEYTPAQGRSYYGRGIIQLSWNYNYGAFSAWLYDNGITLDGLIDARDTLLKRPDYVATKGDLSILSGIWFWMTPQGAKPSSHDVLFGDVYNVSQTSQEQGLPQRNDSKDVPVAAGDTTDEAVFAYRLGTVINIVNGGLECNRAAKWHAGPPQRVSYYNAFAKYFNSNISGLGITTLSKINGAGIWDMKFSDSSDEILKSAVCYNQKSYYGW